MTDARIEQAEGLMQRALALLDEADAPGFAAARLQHALDTLKRDRPSGAISQTARLHRPCDDANAENYPLKRIAIELQAPHNATIDDMLADLDEIAELVRAGEREFAAEALFGYRVTVDVD